MITILQNPAIADCICFELKDNGTVRGSVLARIEEGTIVLFSLESEEELFYDGLVRAVLGYARNRGIDRARFDIFDERKQKRLRGFGFLPENGTEMESVEAFFFADHCS